MNEAKKPLTSLVIFIVICLVVEMVGGFCTSQSIATWYPTLIKPSWNPPDWLFGPVWSILYICIAISGWLIYTAKNSSIRSRALILYWSQLGANVIWTFLFFVLKSPILGLIDIAILFVLITLTMLAAWSVRKLATLLLVPYLIWIMYAISLNIGIWWLNNF